MIDRKKIIKALEGCDLWIGVESECDGDRECPYANVEKGNVPCVNGLIKDALALLKEQEQAMKEKDGTISNLIAQIKEISQCYERVVLCKDCKNWHINYVPIGEQHGCDVMRDYTPPDGYCFKAVKRDV